MSSSVSDNVSYGHGGGAFGATLLQSEIVGNRILPAGAFGPYYGAGVYGGYVESSLLQENGALGFGDLPAYGGGAANATLNLVEVCDNRAPFGGGAANSVIDCCTIYGNEASRECGGLYFASGGEVESSIVWKNVPDQIVDHFGVMVEYSTVQHGWPGLHNTSLNPMFWYEDSCDFNLRPGSYCIDNGDPSEKDPDGSRCDMGARPYQPDYCGTPEIYCEAEVNSAGCLPQIGFQGTPSLKGADDFIITATNVLGGQSGLLVWGYGAGEKPFLGSSLCVTGPLVRTPVQSTGGSGLPDPRCTGTMSFHLSQQYMDDHFLWHGRAIFAQYLYRDPGDPDSFGHTEGLHLVICP
jgi:hypothetical protein